MKGKELPPRVSHPALRPRGSFQRICRCKISSGAAFGGERFERSRFRNSEIFSDLLRVEITLEQVICSWLRGHHFRPENARCASTADTMNAEKNTDA